MNKKKFLINSSLISLCIFFITLILVIFDKFSLDNIVQNYILQIQNPLMNTFFIFLGNYSEIIMIVLAVFLIIALYLQKKKMFSIILPLTLTIGYLINSGIKLLVQRERPLMQLVPETDFSFASNHSVFAMILFSWIIYFYKDEIKNQTTKYFFIAINIFLIFIVGFSRIYLNIHWFSDVIGGYALGFFLFNLGIFVLLSINKKFLN